MRRAALACAITVGLLIGIALPTSAIGLTQVTLSCDDGTSVTLVVDTDTLTSLAASVQAMLDYPAGLTCTLVQSPLPIAFGAIALASAGSNPFIVAGGRWQVDCKLLTGGLIGGMGGRDIVARVPGAWYSLPASGSDSTQTPGFFWVNIAVNVHQKDSTDTSGNPPFVGTLNETIPANQTCETTSGTISVGEAHFGSTPTCLLILPPGAQPPDAQAFVTSKVTETSGATFPADASGSVTAPSYVHFGFQDNGNPPGQNPNTSITPTTDTLNGPPATAEGTQSQECDPAQWTPIHPLGSADGQKQYGNISIHNGG